MQQHWFLKTGTTVLLRMHLCSDFTTNLFKGAIVIKVDMTVIIPC